MSEERSTGLMERYLEDSDRVTRSVYSAAIELNDLCIGVHAIARCMRWVAASMIVIAGSLMILVLR